MTQQPIAVVHDHACPNCGALTHRARQVPDSAPMPRECQVIEAERVIRLLGGM